jgi:hypothetical protein
MPVKQVATRSFPPALPCSPLYLKNLTAKVHKHVLRRDSALKRKEARVGQNGSQIRFPRPLKPLNPSNP